jgi:hypothetical protein
MPAICSLIGFLFAAQCLLWVKSGRDALKFQCPLYPRKRTSASAMIMSALCQKQNSALRQRLALFDDLIGGNVQRLIRWRVRQLERIGNGATGDLAIVDIETITQMQVIVERPPPSLVGECEDK